jgi:SAM-dependent methyltransferase
MRSVLKRITFQYRFVRVARLVVAALGGSCYTPGMTQTGYEYGGLMAASWDLLRGDTSKWADRPFYREIIGASGQPVLDVGCGTGRLLLDYLAAGFDVEGVDNSPEMLALCRTKAQQLGLQPTLYLQQMETLDLPRRYRTIIVPSSSFQLLTDPPAATAAMERFFHHLAPGGTLVMPFMILWTPDEQAHTVEIRPGVFAAADWYRIAQKERPEDGLLVRRWVRSTYDVPQQLEHTQDRYELLRDGEIVTTEDYARSPATRWYTQDQAIRLYAAAGFVNIHLLHEFTQQPATREATLFCVCGNRPVD